MPDTIPDLIKATLTLPDNSTVIVTLEPPYGSWSILADSSKAWGVIRDMAFGTIRANLHRSVNRYDRVGCLYKAVQAVGDHYGVDWDTAHVYLADRNDA